MGDGKVLNVQDGRQFIDFHKQVACVLHQRQTPLRLVAKVVVNYDNSAFKIFNTTSGFSNFDFCVITEIGLVYRQHIFALNHKGVETFG
ncbi:hypothetical protein TNCV_409801 [Trichonephila clavipes]|nr:hypothetical protein TNCV_409801 [Trichonephila clavipes]